MPCLSWPRSVAHGGPVLKASLVKIERPFRISHNEIVE